MNYHEWIGIPLHDGWIVHIVLRPEAEEWSVIEYDCTCLIHVSKGVPIRIMMPDYVRAAVLTLCVDGGRDHEHAPVPMMLAKLPQEASN